MDAGTFRWYYPDMCAQSAPLDTVPAWNLYGEARSFPDILHCELITDRAAGLDWVIGAHQHPHLHQFFLLQSGRVEMSADGERLSPDTPCLISVPKGVIHGFGFSAGTDGYVVTVPLQSLPELFDAKSPMAPHLARFSVSPADAAVGDVFRRLHGEHEARRPARLTMLKALATELACLVIRRQPPPRGRPQSGLDPRFAAFEALVLEHFREHWSLEDYAYAVGLSGRHLGRLCRSATGQSPTEYIETVTMREACRLLVYTRDGIAGVGYQLGFDDPSYFSRAFRRHTGLSPGEYRAAFEKE